MAAIYDRRSKVYYRIGNYKIDPDGEYPQDWFKKNPGRKPKVTIPYIEFSLVEAISSLRHKDARDLSSDVIKSVLHYFTSRITDLLEEDWIVDGVTIGVKGTSVSPASLYDVTLGNDRWEGFQGPEEKDPEFIIASLLFLYRLIRVPTSRVMADTIEGLTTRFRAVYSQSPFYGAISAKESLSILDNDLNFRKLIASYDMFLNRFPNNQYARMRIGTMPSRWRDCSAFKNIFETYNLLGLQEISDYAAWIWEPAIHADLQRLFKEPFYEGEGSKHGYFFYASDSGLINKSIYSVTLNPAVHVFNQIKILLHIVFIVL